MLTAGVAEAAMSRACSRPIDPCQLNGLHLRHSNTGLAYRPTHLLWAPVSGLASEPSSTMSNQAVSSAKRAFVRFVDEDVLQRRIAASVLNDLKHVTDDPNLAPLRAAITKSQEEQIPYWELRIFVRWLAHRLEAQSYMEIGVRTGWSLLQVAQERPHIELTAFDMWVRDYAAAENSSPTKLRSLLEAGSYAGKARFVSGDSHLTLPAFIGGLDMGNKGRQHGTFDIVTVDGDHSAEGARQDLDLCVDLVKPGGAILFDDLVHDQHPDLLTSLTLTRSWSALKTSETIRGLELAYVPHCHRSGQITNNGGPPPFTLTMTHRWLKKLDSPPIRQPTSGCNEPNGQHNSKRS